MMSESLEKNPLEGGHIDHKRCTNVKLNKEVRSDYRRNFPKGQGKRNPVGVIEGRASTSTAIIRDVY